MNEIILSLSEGFVLVLPDLESLDTRPILLERDLEEHVRVLEETLFETYNEELGCLEVLADHQADVLRVRQV